MRSGTASMATGVRWTHSGAPWADFVLTALPYGLRPDKDKATVRMLHTALLRALPGESLLLGVCASMDPAAVVDKMLTGIDPAAHPQWAAECQATLDWLDEIGPGKRIYWLSVPLATTSPLQVVRQGVRAALTGLGDALALPRTPVPPAEVARRTTQAAAIAAAIPAPFRPTAATPAQMMWLHQHAVRRGLFQDLDLPAAGGDVAGDLLAPASGCVLSDVVLDEGAMADHGGATARAGTLTRRHLKVTDASAVEAGQASYQALSVIAGVPGDGFAFPGGEVIGRIDECGLDVDWAMRLSVRAASSVIPANNRALNNLNEQYDQRSAEVSHATSALDRIGGALADYAKALDADQLEVETQATIILAVAGASAESARAQGAALADHFSRMGYKLVAPLGYQQALWKAMQPGIAASRAVREFAQITTSTALAATVPLASTALGDTGGSLLGLNIAAGPMLAPGITCGPTSPVFHDLEGASDANVSGSVAVAGELGAGKTATLMKLAGDVVDKGGQLVIADRTAKGEWAEWAKAIPGAVVVDASAPTVSLDPLRVFGIRIGSAVMASFLATLLNVSPSSESGVLLADVLDPAYLAAHHLDSSGALVAHLVQECALEGAGKLGRLVSAFARRDLGRVIFDASIPALQTTAPAMVMRTHGLALPSREELEHAHLFSQLGLEKIYGRALNALIAALARRVCFADTSTLAAFVVSEMHAMTISFEGERELIEFVRDGRKHRAQLLADSHDPAADFGSVTLRGLIPTRILMRQRDKTLARRSLAWLDLDPDDEALIEMVRTATSPTTDGVMVPEHRRGEATMRDMAGNVGRIKIMLPARDHRRAAITAGGTAAARTPAP